MAIISQAAVKDLKSVYFDEYGRKLSDKEASELAVLLMHIFLVLFAKNPEKLVKEIF